MDTHLPTPICQGLCYQFYSFQGFMSKKIIFPSFSHHFPRNIIIFPSFSQKNHENPHVPIIFLETSSISTLQKRPIFGGPSLPQAPMVWSCGPARRHGASRPRWWSHGEKPPGGDGFYPMKWWIYPWKMVIYLWKMVKNGDLPIKNG